MEFANSGFFTTLANTSYVRFMGKIGEAGTDKIVASAFTGKTFTFNGTTYNLTMSKNTGGSGGGSTPEGNTLTCTRVTLGLDGTETPSTTRVSTDYIPVTISNSTIAIDYSGLYQYAIRLYDSSKNFIGYTDGSLFKNFSIGWGTKQETVTDSSLTSNVAYVRLLFRADAAGTAEINTISGTLTVNSVKYTLTM